jgi:sulfotransferase
MDNGIHFISGLPRSGTTLLSAILSQNPRFHAGVTSPVFQLLTTLQPLTSARSEFHSFFDDSRRIAIERGVVTNYYDRVHGEKLVFDTNRFWTIKLATIARLFPDARMICCVRSVAWIIDSIERLIQQNPLEPSRLFNFEAVTNIYSRADSMTATLNGFIGVPFAGLREAFYGLHSDRLILVTYESLTRSPGTTLAAIYQFIGEPLFSHDFHNVRFATDAYDASIGLAGLHRVAPVVEYRERRTILPPDLFRLHEASAFWREASQNPTSVKVV